MRKKANKPISERIAHALGRHAWGDFKLKGLTGRHMSALAPSPAIPLDLEEHDEYDPDAERELDFIFSDMVGDR